MKENKHDELEESEPCGIKESEQDSIKESEQIGANKSEPCGIKEKLKQWYDEQEFATLDDIKLALTHARIGLRWMLLSIIIGLLVGAFSSFFAWSLQMVTALREANPWLLYFLPAGGLVIVGLYRLCGAVSDKGTNILLHAVQENYCNVPALMAPLIFTATLITHLFGGSAGREGAALQMGGSLGNSIGRLFRQKKYNRKILVMSVMSAAFSAVFGTPLAASVFPMEMVNVGGHAVFCPGALRVCCYRGKPVRD